jgi:hypothetical protein
MFAFLLWALTLNQTPALADDAVNLAPIVVEGTAADALQYDPIVPAFTKPKLESQSASGSITREVSDDLPIPITDYGVPGVTTQVRGLGRTVEDTNVQALGIPLNPPQGGGFDYSTFPQFLWSGYSFQVGPSRGAYDPQAVSGTMTLTPWTSQALDQKENGEHVVAGLADSLTETAAAAKYDNAALLFGWSTGNASGPTGSFSARVFKNDEIDTKVHLLATDLTSISPGSTQFPTPNATTKNARYIPIVENDVHFTDAETLKSSIYYDRDYLRYDNGSYSTNDRAEQFGTENALILGDTILGFSARRQTYRETDFEAPAQEILHAQAAHTWHARALTFDASLDGDYLSAAGIHPGGSAGARIDLTPGAGMYARVSYTERFPSLLARYYQDQFFIPNPHLTNETVETGIVGADGHWDAIDTELQLVTEWRQNAQITVPYQGSSYVSTTENVGNVQSLSVIYRISDTITPWFTTGDSIRLADSRIQASGEMIPYDPHVTNLLRFNFHEKGTAPRSSAEAVFRALSRAQDGFGGSVPGYLLTDLQFEERIGDYGWIRELRLQGRIEDLFNRQLEVIAGYPWTGRQVAVSVVGNF